MRYIGRAVDRLYSRIMIAIAFCLLLVVASATLAQAAGGRFAANAVAAADPGAYALTDTLVPIPEPEPEPIFVGKHDPVPTAVRIRTGAHTFLTNKMSDAYDPVFTGSVEFLTVRKGFGLGFEVGWTRGEGTPPLVDSGWMVTDSWVEMSAVLLQTNVHYNLLDDTGSELFGPYAAAGPGMWVGGERISAEATRAPVGIVEGFKVEQLALGISFGLSAMVGTTVRIKGRIKALVEARYVLGTSGGMLDLVPEEEDNDRLDATLYSAVERPGFNFTGWQITFGVQW